MAEIVKIKVSSLTEAVSLDNLVVLGVDGANNSVKVPILLLKGNKGDNGIPIELQKTTTHLQWRYVGGSWVNLVALADLKGDKGDTGANIELQKSSTHLQWRVSGTTTWNDLVSLADLKGAKGDTGEGFIIKGYYNTLSALQLAVPTPNAGDAYGVGNTAPFDIYVYDSVSSAWVNNGALQGPAGASSYTYIAYASNDQGADFSLTDGAYIAIKTTTEPIANPVAADFAGLWKHYKITAAEVAAGIEIGGRNYLLNSAISSLTGFLSITNFTQFSIENGNELRLKGLSGGTYAYAGFPHLTNPIPVNRVVTLSLKAKNYTGFSGGFVLSINGNNGISVPLSASGEWTNFKITFTPAPYTPDPNYFHLFYIEVHAASFDFAIKEVKVELGNIATDWTPAPEDLLPKSGGTLSGDIKIKKNYPASLYLNELDNTAFRIIVADGKTYFQAGAVGQGDEVASSGVLNFSGIFGTEIGGLELTAAGGVKTIYHSGNLDPSLLAFLTSQNTVTTLASLPVTKRVIVASVTAATTLSLAATLEVGRELHIKVYNTSASAITQPLPTSAPFESKKVDGTNISSISIPAGGSVEISILSVTDKYIIKTDA